MSAGVTFAGSGPDTKVRANSLNPPKELNFLGAGVSVVANDVTGAYDITISGASVGAATTSTAGVVQLATSAQTTVGLAVQANDTRLSDSRTPTLHASTHKSGGTDFIRLDEFAAPTDVSTLNTSTVSHGLAPKLSNNAAQYLDGTGGWTTPTITVGQLPSSVLTDTNTKTVTNKTMDSVTNTFANQGNFKYNIYRSGSTVYCKNNITGLIESSSTTHETPIQYALTNGARTGIFIQNNSYVLSAGFTGFTLSQNETWVVCDPGALITVPSGYTGKLWIFPENTEGQVVQGGRYSETVTISRLWTFAYFEVADGNIALTKIKDVYVRFCGKFVEYKCTGTIGFINGNTLEDSFVDQFTQGIVFNQVSTQTSNNGINRNNFRNVILQSYASTTDGIINISGISNYFDDCKVWDMPVGGNGVTILAGATDTIFIAGINKTAQGFSDAGVRTKIIENANVILPSATLVSPTITSPTFISTVLAKTNLPSSVIYNDQANNYGASNQNFRSGTLGLFNPAQTQIYQFVGSAIAGNYTITLPLLTGSDTMAVLNFAQTFTNKTIAAASNTITGIVDANISAHTTSKITTTTKGLLNSAIVYNDQTNTYGAFAQIYPNSQLKIQNPAATFNYIIASAAIAADRTLTLPLLTGNDVAVTEAFTQTLTNKTITAASNTITDTSAATGDILRHNGTRFVRKGIGTGLQVLRTNSGATDIEWASLNAENTGSALASGTGSATVFNIPHSIGSTPAVAFIQCSTHSSAFTYVTDATNITVTFVTAPGSGTNNVKFYWRAVA